MTGISENVKKCVAILKGAKNDTEKFAALFMTAKLTKGDECCAKAKLLLFEAIGHKFLSRLLCTAEVPVDCPPQIYKSIALSILSSFCSEPELAHHCDMIAMIPSLLEVIQNSETDDSDDNLMVVSEAYKCLESIISNEHGLTALRKADGISKMAEIYLQQTFEIDKALAILNNLLLSKEPQQGTAAVVGNSDALVSLLDKVGLDFRTDSGERKFELCSTLHTLLSSVYDVKDLGDWMHEMWPSYLREGLKSILSSKIGKAQRDPALKLASVTVDLLGVDWCITDEEKPKQFLLLLIHLCSVEVRMQLEDRTLAEVLANAQLVAACFLVLELSLRFISADTLELDGKEKQQLYVSLKGAFAAIVGCLGIVAASPDTSDPRTMTPQLRAFVGAAVRALAAWMAQDPSALRDPIAALLPFILRVANDSFTSVCAKRQAGEPAGRGEPDLLRLLLPGLCHLAVDNKARRLLLDLGQVEILVESFRQNWNILSNRRPPVPRAQRLAVLKAPRPEIDPVAAADSREALSSLCNFFMNLTALEPDAAESAPAFKGLRLAAFDAAIDLPSKDENLPLHAHLSVLSLLLLKAQADTASKSDFAVCRVIQSAVRFFWDAYNIDESHDSSTIVVSMAYKRNWLELSDMWFLGMQTLAQTIRFLPWISEFIAESGWITSLIETLSRARAGALPPDAKSAYEDLLCAVVDAHQSTKDSLKKSDVVLQVCRTHRFMDFGKRLFGN